MRKSGEDLIAPSHMPFRMFRIKNNRALELFDSKKLLGKLSKERKVGDDENYVDRQVQFVNHITNYYMKKEELPTNKKSTEVHFLITNMFCMNEVQLTSDGDKDKVTRVRKIKRG